MDNKTPKSETKATRQARVIMFTRRYGWCIWSALVLTVAGWNCFTWQFYVAFVPLVLLIAMHDEATIEIGLKS